jgi:hypothetical protein
MDHEVGLWKMAFFHGPTWWSNFHGLIEKIHQSTKLLGPSLGVNWMWTKRNDHAPKNESAEVFNICPKRVVLRKEIQV